jgi:Heterokaryon incompatibility protein (HET)
MSVNEYGTYNRLNQERSEIRLLTILPLTKGTDDHQKDSRPLNSYADALSAPFGETAADNIPLSCDLKTVSLDNEHPKYFSLSYRWGDINCTKPIWVNGNTVEVGANLEQALRHIRQQSSPVTIWADAICVNQSDEQEKIDQVKMMGRIYREATVLAWLGLAADDSDIAMEALDDLGKQAVETGLMSLRGPDFLSLQNHDAPEHVVAIGKNIDELSDRTFSGLPHLALKAMSDREYWMRILDYPGDLPST